MRLLSLIVSLSVVGGQAYAQPLVKPGTCELVVASRSSLAAAQNYVRSSVASKTYTKIFKAENGWYAVSIGALTPSEEVTIIPAWKASGKIPQDAYCPGGATFVSQHNWQSGSQTATKSPAKSKPSGSQLSDAEATAIAIGTIGAAVGILGAIVGGVARSGSSGGSSTYVAKYGCEFYCEGQFGNAGSVKFRVNTPHSNSADAQNFVRREYEGMCKKYPFYSGGGGTASVSYPYCETYYYE
jgi:hypothetical protein